MHLCSAWAYNNDNDSLENIIHYVRKEYYCGPLGSQGRHGSDGFYMGMGDQLPGYWSFAVQASRAVELSG